MAETDENPDLDWELDPDDPENLPDDPIEVVLGTCERYIARPFMAVTAPARWLFRAVFGGPYKLPKTEFKGSHTPDKAAEDRHVLALGIEEEEAEKVARYIEDHRPEVLVGGETRSSEKGSARGYPPTFDPFQTAAYEQARLGRWAVRSFDGRVELEMPSLPMMVYSSSEEEGNDMAGDSFFESEWIDDEELPPALADTLHECTPVPPDAIVVKIDVRRGVEQRLGTYADTGDQMPAYVPKDKKENTG
ncbi:hypothetical protein HOG48_01500 [Candidatus Peregrinibacteria bacterium]|mgnify:CR=1 FL=1|jgi:hypothetical protein|nr:hypothetical protein [Candidatus Peregrinibacteria bacterium]